MQRNFSTVWYNQKTIPHPPSPFQKIFKGFYLDDRKLYNSILLLFISILPIFCEKKNKASKLFLYHIKKKEEGRVRLSSTKKYLVVHTRNKLWRSIGKANFSKRFFSCDVGISA